MNRRSQIARLRTGGLVGASTTPLPGDEHWDDVTLLLDGSDPTDDLSNTNQDASNSITNTGGVSSVSMTGPTGYGTVDALSFDGSNYLTTSHYSASLYNQDFTIEGWFKLPANPYPTASTNAVLFTHRSANTTHGVIAFVDIGNDDVALVVGDGATWAVLENTTGVNFKTGWQHIAVTRAGDTYRLFMDGAVIATATSSATVAVTGDFTLMASNSSGTDPVAGDVFDFRITEGVARYTAAFTPPTQSFLPFAARPYSGTFGLGDEHWNDVVLLLDGTDPATDLSTQQQTVTETGSSTGFSNETDPFGSTQDVFDFNRAEASGSGYQVSSSPITLGSSPFTIEMWIKLDSASLTSTQLLYSERSAGTTCVTFRVEGQKLTFFKDNSGGGKFSGATTLAADTWYHVALTYDSSTVRLFLDGQRDGSSNQSLTFNPNVAPVLGYDRAFPETTYQLDGQMAQVRVTKGVARYTAAFTPPTARFPTNAPVVGRRGLGQTVGRSGESNTKSATAYDLTGDTADHTISSDYRITKSVTTGDQWSYLKYDISSFSSGYIYAELMLSSANSSYTTFGVGDGTVPTGVYGATTSTAGIRSRQNGELAITTWPLSSTSATLISSAFASFPLVFSILIDCATKDVWMAYSSENGSDRKWVTGASTSTSTFDINQPFVSGFTGLSEIAVQLSQTSNRYADINFGTDGTFGGATSSNESSSWFFDPPAEIVDLYTTTPGTLRTRGYLGADPAGSTSVYTFEMWGAGGGGGGTDDKASGTTGDAGPGGAGAYVSGTLQGLTSGDTITVFAGVPGKGGSGTVGGEESAGNGGGSSAIIINGSNLAAVAGGGGGGGSQGSGEISDATGGRGGNSVGGGAVAAAHVSSTNGGEGGNSGYWSSTTSTEYPGAVPSGGHANSAAPTKTLLMQDGGGGSSPASTAGNAYQGGNTPSTVYGGTGGTGGKSDGNEGGGGGAGGGYFGGSGGGAASTNNEAGAGGGGGLSYINATYVSSYASAEGSYEAGTAHTGAAVNQTAGSSATAYATTNGKGGDGAGVAATDGTAGQPGRVVLYEDGVKVAEAITGNGTANRTVSGGGTARGMLTLYDRYVDALVVKPDGLTAATAGDSAAQILADYPSSPDGIYYIKDGTGTKRVYCDMTNGGWMLYSSFASTNTLDATNYPAWNGNRILHSQLGTYGYAAIGAGILNYNDGTNSVFPGTGYAHAQEFYGCYWYSTSGPQSGGVGATTWNGPSDVSELRIRWGQGSPSLTGTCYLDINGSQVTSMNSTGYVDSTYSFNPSGTSHYFGVREDGIVGISFVYMR